MKRAIGLIMCLSILVFTACKKKTPAPVQPTTTRLATSYDDSSRRSIIYYYSPSFLIRQTFDDSGSFFYNYHYLDAESTNDVSINGSSAYSVIYIWNSQSLADSSFVLNLNGTTGIRKKYTYNSNSYLTGVKWYSSSNILILTESFTISNGNITQHSYTVIDSADAGSLPVGSYSYQYYSGQTNSLGNLYTGQSYLGTSSANPVMSSVYTYNSVTYTTDYTYHYSNGLITSQLVYADSAGARTTQVDSIAYQYYFQ